jgi:hypothetical protein
MNRVKLLTFILLLISKVSLGHSDFWTYKDFGNVKVVIKTGFDYEEINKCWIIGELSHQLCKQLNYKNPVFLYFDHHYTGDVGSLYFIGHNNTPPKKSSATGEDEFSPKINSLVITEVNRQFTPAITLRLLEYAIFNVNRVKTTQTILEYRLGYAFGSTKSIDTMEVRKITKTPMSSIIRQTLTYKIYRLKGDRDDNELSYFFQNNNFHVFYKTNSDRDSVLLTVDNIYQFAPVSWEKVLVFDTDSSFYFAEGVNFPTASDRKIIDTTYGNYRPYEVNAAGSNKVVISFWSRGAPGSGNYKERSALYMIKTNTLIQDLDQELRYRDAGMPVKPAALDSAHFLRQNLLFCLFDALPFSVFLGPGSRLKQQGSKLS